MRQRLVKRLRFGSSGGISICHTAHEKPLWRVCIAVSLAIGLFVIGCEKPDAPSSSSTASENSDLADGLYGVLQIGTKRATLPKANANQRVIEYQRRFVQGGDEEPPEWFLLDVVSHVPLQLTEAPTEKPDAIELSLSPNATIGLQSLSTKFVGKTVAVIVGGEVATAHLVREPINMPKLQISC